MDILGRLSIRTRLYFGTVFSLVLLIVIGGLGYLALDRTRDTLQVLFSERVQTLTDMADLRTTLGTLRRTEKDIILNFNNSVEVAAQRETWARTLAALRKSLTAVRQVQAGDPAFAGSIDKALAEIQQYEAGISPIFEQIERAQLDGAGGAAYADRLKSHMETTDQILASLAQSARENMERGAAGRGGAHRHHVRGDRRRAGAGPGGADPAHLLQRALHHRFPGPGPLTGRTHRRRGPVA